MIVSPKINFAPIDGTCGEEYTDGMRSEQLNYIDHTSDVIIS
jgi:hypothetical protein